MRNKKQSRIIRHKRVRRNIQNSNRFRLVVFRSNKHIYCQLIDDENSKTVAATSDIKLKNATKQEKAKTIGMEIAKKAGVVKIKDVVFDRAGYKYHGRVKALAEGAREGGLNF